jgi:hypothetical protein
VGDKKMITSFLKKATLVVWPIFEVSGLMGEEIGLQFPPIVFLFFLHSCPVQLLGWPPFPFCVGCSSCSSADVASSRVNSSLNATHSSE